MTAVLSPAEHAKLIRVLEVARCAGDGETLAAVHAARRILAGRSWPEIWPTPIAGESPRQSTGQATWRASEPHSSPHLPWWHQASFCAQHVEHLDSWEQSFITDLLRRAGRSLTPKQIIKLRQIVARIQRAEGLGF